jgi:phage terminase large subunit GpA-like protein
MNAAGTFVAPGQIIHPDGSVEGHPPDATMLSLWVSGLASPFVSWGERVEEVLLARLSGDEDAEMGAVTKVGELFSPAAGEALDWHVVAQQRRPYRRGEIPEGVAFLTAGVDVQKDRLIYVVRGWGEHQESWLIDHDEIYGETHEPAVWLQLAGLLERGVAGLPILRTFIDSGFRPGKRDAVPEHAVYEFCRRYGRLVYATKGYDRRDKPLSVNRIDVDAKGARPRYGLDLVRLSTDFFKSWVHRRVNWPAGQPGGWHLPEDVSDGYCRQIVSETRVVSRDGQARWEQRSRENHALDCEALAYAAAYMLGIHRLSSATLRLAAAKAAEGPTQRAAPPSATPAPQPRGRENSWLGAHPRLAEAVNGLVRCRAGPPRPPNSARYGGCERA